MDKKLLLGFSGLIILVLMALLSYSAIMNVQVEAPTSNTNYSGLILINSSIFSGGALNNFATNLTFYFYNNSNVVYNASILNGTTSIIGYLNATLNTSLVMDGYYNFTINATNVTNDVVTNATVQNITIDNTPPNVTINAPLSAASVKGSILVNITSEDATVKNINYVFFNISNSTNGYRYNATSPAVPNWNITLDTTTLADGRYNITIFSNDSVGNLNSTQRVNITVDNTAPAVTLTKSATSDTHTLVVTVDVADDTSGVSGACSFVIGDGMAGSIDGTGTSQTLTVTNLGCNSGVAIDVTCTDVAGTSTTTSTSTLKTDACTGGSSPSSGGGSSSSTTSWTNTVVVSEPLTVESEPVQRELSAKQRVKVTVAGGTHHVGVKSLTDTSAVIEIAPDPVEATFNVGETKKFDLNADGTYDLSVTLNGITSGKADVTITAISEAVSTTGGDTGATDGTEDTTEVVQPGVEETGKGLGATAWVVIAVVVIVIIVLAVLLTRKRKRR